MKTNDIKKGARILLHNGWYGTMFDNARGNRRMVEVEGYVTEIGSVYSHDIARVSVNNEWIEVEHTEAQNKLRFTVQNVFS